MQSLLKRPVIILCGILFVAGLLRTPYLGSIPSGFHGDEAAYGYNAYALIKTGADEYGRKMPWVFQSFNDYKPALYAYFDIPFIVVLGLTESAVRFPAAIFGILTVLILYLFVKELFPKSPAIYLISAFLLAISPWHIQFSRTTSEVVIALFFLLGMALSILKLNRNPGRVWIITAIIAAFLSLSAYTAARFFVPIAALGTMLFSFAADKPKRLYKPFLLILAGIILGELLYMSLGANNRFSQVSIFHHPNTRLILEEQIREDEFMPVAVTRFFHNKLVNYIRKILQNYSQYFSLEFLALSGGLPVRQHVPDSGLFYIWEILFLILGIWFAITRYRTRGLLLFGLWLFLLIPTAITYDDVPNVQRSIVILPFMVTIIAVGITESLRIIRMRRLKFLIPAVISGIIIIGVWEGMYFLHQYVVHFRKHQPWHRDYAMKGLVSAMNELSPGFNKIVVTKDKTSYIHILFYNAYDPLAYRATGSNMDKEETGFAKYVFNIKECPLPLNKKGLPQGDPQTLYVEAGVCKIPKKNVRLLRTINWADGQPAYKIVQYTGPELERL